MRRVRAIVFPVALLFVSAGCRSKEAVPAPAGDAGSPVASASVVPAPTPVVSVAAAASALTSPPPRPLSGALFAIDKADSFLLDGAERWEKDGAAWIDARVAEAKKKTPALVRVPLIHRGEWGCDCPEYYLGVMSTTNPTNRWITPVFEKTAPEPPLEVRKSAGTVQVPGSVYVAEGFFTGESSERKLHKEGDAYKLAELRVLRLRPAQRASDAKPVVVRPTLPPIAGIAGGAPASPPDGKSFFAITESFDTANATGREDADRLAADLRARGFAGAEVIDSTTVPGLFCCYWAVTLGRYATEAEAARAASEAAAKKVVAAVRRGY